MVATRKRIEALDPQAEFQVWERTTRHLRENAGWSNVLAGAVAAQGVPLAGKWPLTSAGQQGKQCMDLRTMRVQQFKVCEFISNGWTNLAMHIRGFAIDSSGVSFQSGLAAELLAKDIIASHSVQPDRSHDVYGLEQQLDRLPMQAWESKKLRQKAAKSLKELNGITTRLHLGVYADRPAESESLEKGVRRLILTMKLQAMWLSRCASRNAVWNSAVQDIGRLMLETAIMLRDWLVDSRNSWTARLPEEAALAIIEWEAIARELCREQD